MMNLDEQIKASLKAEQHHLHTVLDTEPGLFEKLAAIYQGKMRWWAGVGTLLAFVLTGVFMVSAYQFYVATQIEQQLFWAVCFITSLMMQIAVKLWLFMEMNRQSIIKEIKRSEYAMSQQLNTHARM
ncbi:DUF6768 family protein [Pseudoalteromonas mariniglutinosa]